MKTKHILPLLGCITALAFTARSHAASLVTNGGFEAPVTPFQIGFDAWAQTIGTNSGTFTPGVTPPPLINQVAFMGDSNQILQTFAVSLQANTIYTISFDSMLSVGVSALGDTLSGAISYGTGSGTSSGYGGDIAGGDIISGTQNFSFNLTNTAQSYSFTFTTPASIMGSANNLAIYLQTTFTDAGKQLYLDNVSVLTTAVPEPSTVLLIGAGLGALLLRRRSKA